MSQLNTVSTFFGAALAINGFLVVALGAFGAHALEARLGEAALTTWQTAVHYHMFHLLGLLAVAWLSQQAGPGALLAWSGGLFLAGILLFSGSLYLLALTGLRTLGMITPLGGLAWLAAWGCLLFALLGARG